MNHKEVPVDIKNNGMMRQLDYQAYQELRETRRTDKIEQLRESAPLEQVREKSAAERAEGIGYLNNSMAAVDRMHENRYPYDMTPLFPMSENDKKTEEATAPRECDNEDAQKVRKEYRDLYMEIKKDLNYAKMLFKKLGPGTHELTDKNGKKIAAVKIDKDDQGNISVAVDKNDGSKLNVTYNEKNPGQYKVEKTDKEGRIEVLERKGTACSRTKDGVTESYDVNKEGAVVKEKTGPGSDDKEKTVVNDDGSTDSYTMVYYDENGEPVYDHDHKDARKTEYKDAGAGKAIDALNKENPKGQITGDQMEKLIINATKDADNQAAGKEYEDLKVFVQKNNSRLSPEAKTVWEIYDRYVQESKKKGQTGIPEDEYKKMQKEMKEAKEGKPDEKYQDVSAGKAIDAINKKNPKGEITGDHVYTLVVSAIEDSDNQAAGKEYDDLKKFIETNWNRLTPEAKAVWEVYENHARSARARGESGMKEEDYQKMIQEMKAAIGSRH